MINFQRLHVGTGVTLVGLFGFTVYTGVWFHLGMPLEPRYWYWGAGLFVLTWIGFIINLSFSAKDVEEAYAAEKLLADFTRHLYCVQNLRDDAIGPFLADRILNEIKHRPNEYRTFIRELQPGARQVLAQHCAKEDGRLQGELERALKNTDANMAYAAASHVVAQKEDWQHLKRLVEVV